MREHLHDNATALKLGDRRDLFRWCAPEGMHCSDDEHITVREGVEEAVQPGGPALKCLGSRVAKACDGHAKTGQRVALFGDGGHVVAGDDEPDKA